VTPDRAARTEPLEPDDDLHRLPLASRPARLGRPTVFEISDDFRDVPHDRVREPVLGWSASAGHLADARILAALLRGRCDARGWRAGDAPGIRLMRTSTGDPTARSEDRAAGAVPCA
jgi:hypothetical protein